MSNKRTCHTAGCLVMILLMSINITAQELPAPFKIIPSPRQVTLLSEKGLVSGNLKNIVLSGTDRRPVMGRLLSSLPEGSEVETGSLLLVIDTTIPGLPSREGYVLLVQAKGAEIKAKDDAGLFYGCQTLEQLLSDAQQFRKPIPACVITDFPEMQYRAVHFDVKHHLDHMNYYYESIDRLAQYKINAVVFEFEDKLRYQRQPVVGAPQSISMDEMASLTRYAIDRHIEITPLVQGLGHATFILKHRQYAHLRELSWNNWAFCPLHEGTYQVLFDLYRDAIAATPGSKYLHIGGDEIGNIGLCPRCKPMADKEGMLSLSLYWLKRVCEFAAENGRTPIFWDDMPLKHAGVYETTYDDAINGDDAQQRWKKGIPVMDELLAEFPKNCVYMRWNYSMARQPGNILALDWYQGRGLNTMIATATNTEGGMLFQKDERDKGPESSGIVTIRSFIQLAADKNVEGVLCTAWDDKSPHMENYWRGFIAAAEYSWSPQSRNLEQFDAAWLQREFGLDIPDYKSLMDRLRSGTDLWYTAFYRHGGMLDEDNVLQSLPRLEHWLPPLADQEKLVFDYSSRIIDVPHKESPGEWSRKYSDRLEKCRAEMAKYNDLSARLNDLEEGSLKNRYYWELCKALYELQMTTPRLMLALEKYDTDKSSAHKAGIENVTKELEHFNEVWENLKNVYSKTRFISYPPDYVQDRYFHFASQREDLSWMIQAQELLFQKIRQQLNL